MNTTDFFSFSRLCKLMRNDLLVNYKQYLLTIAGAFILFFIVLYMNMPREHYIKYWRRMDYTPYFIMSLLALGALVGSSFPYLTDKVKTSSYLLIPSSSFEKFLIQFLIRIVAGLAIFTTIFWIDAQLARLVALEGIVDPDTGQACIHGASAIDKFEFKSLLIHRRTDSEVIYYNWRSFCGVALIIFSIGVYLFSVRLYFKKMALVKSVIFLAILAYILFVISVGLSHIFYPETTGFEPHNISYIVVKGLYNFEIWAYSLAAASVLFLLPLGYFKLKEKQV